MNIPLALSFALGILITVKGGDYFIDSASWIAKTSGMPDFLIGSTVVSLATALPEIIVSLTAAYRGSASMAAGNAVGSVTANTGLIMALSALLMPSVVKRSRIFSGSVLMLLSCSSLIFLMRGCVMTKSSALIMCSVFIFFALKSAFDAAEASSGSVRLSPSPEDIKINILKLAGGSAGVILGARLLVEKGTLAAGLMGVPEGVIGLTALALGTCLPELTASLSAIIKGRASMSLGNIIGANIIDLTLILPLCALISGRPLPVEPPTVYADLPLCLFVMAVMTVPALIHGRFRRWQGALSLGAYLLYLLSVIL